MPKEFWDGLYSLFDWKHRHPANMVVQRTEFLLKYLECNALESDMKGLILTNTGVVEDSTGR